jgi:hypothetical protein
MTVGSMAWTLWSLAAMSISVNRSMLLLEAEPSVPIPTVTPVDHLRHRRDAGAQLHVAFRIVNDADTEIGHFPISADVKWTA